MSTTTTTTTESADVALDPTGDWLALADIGDKVTLFQRCVQDDSNVRCTTVTGTLENFYLAEPEYRVSVGRKARAVRVTVGSTTYTLTVDHTTKPTSHNSDRDWLLIERM